MKLYYSIEVFKLENFILLTKKLNNEIIDVKGKVINLNAYEKETHFGKMLFKDVQIINKFGCVIFVTFKNNDTLKIEDNLKERIVCFFNMSINKYNEITKLVADEGSYFEIADDEVVFELQC